MGERQRERGRVGGGERKKVRRIGKRWRGEREGEGGEEGRERS